MDANQRSESNNQTNNGANEKWTPGSKGNTTSGPNDHTYPQGAVQQAGLPGSGQQGVQRPEEGPVGTDADWFNRDDSRAPTSSGELQGGSMQSQQTGGSGPQQGITDSHQRQMEMHSEAWGKLEQPVGHRPADSGTDLMAHPANQQGNSQAAHRMNPQDPAQPELQGGSLGRHHGVPPGTTGPAAHGTQAGMPGSEQGDVYGNRPAAMSGNAPGNRQSAPIDHLQTSGGRQDDVAPAGVQASGTQSTGIGSGARQSASQPGASGGGMQPGASAGGTLPGGSGGAGLPGASTGGMESNAQGGGMRSDAEGDGMESSTQVGGMRTDAQVGGMRTEVQRSRQSGGAEADGGIQPSSGSVQQSGGSAQQGGGSVQQGVGGAQQSGGSTLQGGASVQQGAGEAQQSGGSTLQGGGGSQQSGGGTQQGDSIAQQSGGSAQQSGGNAQHSTDREGSQTGPGAREAGTVDVHLSNDVAGGLPRSPGNSGPQNENPGWKPGGSMQRDEAVHQSNDTTGGLPRSPAGANKLAGDRKMDDDTGFSRK
ncbi:hypothetical protein B0920_00150 [Massilia sp. KIM]|uniref:hypothetical protein n=1 Tax=Massilia sp. KIM TaxID=1955422 RepID=UPI00098F2FC4|nr:hypothetical protein [Massilia sp. KIM]OON61951.1 hypothetical protein B0920_00150 [Massilia sp. KIM]